MVKPSLSYIHFRVDWKLIGPESPGQRYERDKFQGFFEKLNADARFGGYDDFSYRPIRCELVRSRGPAPQGGTAFSKVVYADDGLSVVEEWAEDHTKDYCQKLKTVLDAWFFSFPDTIAVVQTCSLRVLAQPQHFDDSRKFLGETVLNLGEAFKSKLSEMPHKVGFTFGCDRKQGDTPIRLECITTSWRDSRSVWIEVRGMAPLHRPLNAAKHDHAEAIFDRCVKFLEDEVTPLIFEYDRETSGPEGDGR